MADDWDLYAVVRGCKSTTQTTRNITITAAGIAPTNPIHTPPDEFKNDPLWDLLSSDELTDPLFSFTNLDDPREANGFQELQQSFFRNPTTTNNDHNPTTNNTTFGPNNIIPNSPTISDFGGSSGSGHHHLQHQQQQQHHAQLQQQQQQLQQQQQRLSMPTHFTRGIPAPGFRGIYGQQQQQKIMQPGDQNLQPQQLQTQQGSRRPRFINPAYPHPRPPTRSQRRRKTQQKKNVHEVKPEDLSEDLWAWRKYGQKPIKGSPHPRNYYRCSSSKGCPARRQVERSTTEPNIFIVTYTGDHTHARPTHRNSLAGSSRNKPSAASTSQKQPINNDSGSTAVPNPSSPTTGLPMTEAVPVANKVNSDNSLDKENEEFDEEGETDENENEVEDDDDDAVIPDMDMSDEIFLRLKELGGTSSNGSGSGSSSLVCTSGENF